MRKHLVHKRFLERRSFMLAGMQLTVSSALLGQLFYLQSFKRENYTTLAEDNRINMQLIVPERGLIIDRFGVRLAENKPNFQLVMERGLMKKRETLFAALRPLLEDPNYPLEEMLQKQIRRTPHSQNIILKDHLSWDEVSALEFHAPQLAGIHIETGTMRHYPLANKASHLLGYVGTPAQNEAQNNRLLKMPNMKIGKNGLEQMTEQRIQGTAGIRYMEINARGQYLKQVREEPSIKGEDIRCAISGELQAYAAERLGEESGSIVVMDILNGDVLCLCSMPSYDPNRFSLGITHNYWGELMGNKKNPLMNKAITGQYPPGSTFKMIVGLKAIEMGIIKPETTFYCPGHFYLGNHRFHCWKPEGHGHMDYREAISQSCDVYFYNVARKMGIEPIAAIAREFGLGQRYDLGLMSEKAGTIPSPEWKRAAYNQPWQAGDTINVSIGQGYVLATPLQLAVMAARLATGKRVTPRLLTDGQPYRDFDELSVSKEVLLLAQMGMIDVTSAPRGTARAAQIQKAGYEMAGKTGTAQVRRITIRGQDQARIPWEQRHHALFVAYAPYQHPRYAAAIVIEHGGGGSSTAAPIGRDILLRTQEIMEQAEGGRFPLIPPTPPATDGSAEG
ncbi:MAG: penicillin-binding protein 2 [Alphaproteobacteria bacterium]|nr:MAG: penicillin-binding protein 2 [Alphaproteobacteria bacterium]